MLFQDLRLTYADSVPQLGGRKPLNPSLKDGVVIRLSSISSIRKWMWKNSQDIGVITHHHFWNWWSRHKIFIRQIHRLASSANFSLALEELDRQVKNRTIVKCSISGILTLSNGNFNNLDDDGYRFHNALITLSNSFYDKFHDARFHIIRETQPLRRLSTCSFKRVSVERFFR